VHSVSAVDPKLLRYDGQFGIQLYAPDGSRTLARSSRTGHGWQVTQCGPRRLWDRVEEAHEFWQQAGRPHYDRFGITATATEQYVWYDHPDSEHRWQLPTPTGPRAIQPIS
jgi:hypothetical protein